MMRLTLPKSLSEMGYRAVAMAALLALCPLSGVQAQEATPPPQGVSRGENFSAKPPAQLFASDCTGAGCHKGPQGLGKKANGIGGLSGFLREHYTNSRESAAALANYLTKLPSGPEPKEPREARSPKPGKPATAATPASGSPNWFEGTPSEGKPSPNEPHKPREAAHTPPGRGPHTAAKPEPGAKPDAEEKREEQPAALARQHPTGEPAEQPSESAAKTPEPPVRPARATRGRHPAAAANAAAPAAVPEPEPEPEPAPAPSPPPAPKQYDIFD
jgi:hypothetical protein